MRYSESFVDDEPEPGHTVESDRSTVEIEGDPIRYAFFTKEDQQRSAPVHEGVIQYVDQSAVPPIRQRALGRACIQSASPSSLRQGARGHKLKSYCPRSGGCARERRFFCRNSRLLVGRCVDIPSHGQAGMQAVQTRTPEAEDNVGSPDVNERESRPPRRHGVQAAE